MKTVDIQIGDCLDVLKTLVDNSIDSIVTDPPYGLSFMGKRWDYDVPSVEVWQECLRVLKHGGHLLSFAGARTYHRMAVNIEDAGFEIRDQIMWVYGSGFPKSLNIGKAVDKLQGNDREYLGTKKSRQPTGVAYEGWGTALKPAHEPIVMARKPLSEKTIAKNVLKWGTGGINVDGCRVGYANETDKNRLEASVEQTRTRGGVRGNSWKNSSDLSGANPASDKGRFPANFIHDGSDEVLGLFPQEAGRFFYCPKANKKERNAGCGGLPKKSGGSNAKGYTQDVAKGIDRNAPIENHHPTVKPLALMQYLCRLVTPPSGVVLDPFMGSGTTGMAAQAEGFGFVGIEREAEYIEIAKARIEFSNSKEQKGIQP